MQLPAPVMPQGLVSQTLNSEDRHGKKRFIHVKCEIGTKNFHPVLNMLLPYILMIPIWVSELFVPH